MKNKDLYSSWFSVILYIFKLEFYFSNLICTKCLVSYNEDINQMLIEIQEPIASADLFSDENLFPEGTSNILNSTRDSISNITDTSGICYH